MPLHYVWLFIAILTETLGTTALQASQQFTRLWPSVGVVLFYGASFYFMAMALKVMPVGIVYAIWSGLGIVLIAGIGFFLFGQRLDLPAIVGLALIIAGILVIHLFSAAETHAALDPAVKQHETL
ncbi:Multidrug transporter EmrE [Sulfitobacter sp. THAF37]|uniref:DMT family transporter n=1 Tax=Sulfitobacter sp. THAF37 TaxID=2587855 RepID=UPI0012692A11|nr:SMR family transporter [Sulfitobacter sp. THAF37]QFT59914.1 Multidrug transporter EmrE [Sulfitobacter sp. THAF37]